MSSPTIPILIAGAGISGHVLALVLLQNGIPVRLIERDSHYRVGQKGAGVQPRTVELHRILGTYDDFNRVAGPLPITRMYPKGTIAQPMKEMYMSEIEEATPAVPMPEVRLLGLDSHEELIRAHIEKLGGSIELSTSLVSFEQSNDHIIAHLDKVSTDGTVIHETIKCRYLVGTEGAHSVVRKTSGMTFLGDSMPSSHIVVGDIHVKRGLPKDAWHVWPTSPGLSESLALRPIGNGSDIFNFTIIGFDGKDYSDVVSTEAAIVNMLHETSAISKQELEFGEVIWSSRYSPHIRMVDRFQVRRAFVAGAEDAAHVHSPTGGQGLNSGFVDAMNLGWKLALALKGLASPTLLDSYTTERLPVIASMLEKTKLLAHQTFGSSTSQPSNLETAFKRGHELFQLGVNYRGSNVVVDDSLGATEDEVVDPYRSGEDGQVRAGDRAPDAPGLLDLNGHKLCIYDLLKTTHHTLLLFSRDSVFVRRALDAVKNKGASFKKVVVLPKGSELGTVEGADHVLQDTTGHAYRGYNIHGKDLPVVIIRPDGWIGATVVDVVGITKYLQAVFAP